MKKEIEELKTRCENLETKVEAQQNTIKGLEHHLQEMLFPTSTMEFNGMEFGGF